MFICKSCLKENYTNNEGIFISLGKCEVCNSKAKCFDIPSKYLKIKKIINCETGI